MCALAISVAVYARLMCFNVHMTIRAHLITNLFPYCMNSCPIFCSTSYYFVTLKLITRGYI